MLHRSSQPLRYRDRVSAKLFPAVCGCRGTFAAIDGRDLHYVEAGDPEAPPLVLVHGFGAWSYSWRHNIGPLSQEFRVVALDLPGFGWSEKSRRGDQSLEAYVRAVTGLMDHLGMDAAVLVGNSMGGEISLCTAVLAPQRVRAVAGLCSSAFIETLPRLGRLIPYLPFAGKLGRRLIMNRNFVRHVLQGCYADPRRLPAEAAECYTAPFSTPGAEGGFVAVMRDFNLGSLTRRFGAVEQPVRLIWGERDPYIPVSDGQRLARLLPKAELVVLPDAAHVPQEEQPETVNRLLAEFARHTYKKD